MHKGTTIGVVTVTYNSANVLPEFLSCIVSQTYENIIIYAVDNGSQDKTVELLRACADGRLKIIANPDNRGIAEGNNQGIRAAIADGCGLILLINNDTEFDDGLIQGLATGIDEYNCDMVCPKMLCFDEPQRIWAAGGEFQPLLGYRSRHFGEGDLDRGQFDGVRVITFVPACCVLIRQEVFASIGLMDPRYFVYAEDTDFMYRAMKAGKSMVYLPNSRLLHKVGRLTGGEESAFSIFYGTRNRLFFLVKHFGPICAVPWMAVCQISWCACVLVRRKQWKWWRLKQRAFFASLKMPT